MNYNFGYSMTKRLTAVFMMVVVLVLGLVVDVAAESGDEYRYENPFSLTATPVGEDGSFTVNINIEKDCRMEAYHLIVSYDSSGAVIAEGSHNYGNYISFLKKYNQNQQGMCLGNHKKESSEFVFVGAQPVSDAALVSAGQKIAYIRFCAKDVPVSGEAAGTGTDIEELLQGITLKVVSFSDGDMDYAKEYPEIYNVPVTAVSGDDSYGDIAALGDVNGDGSINIIDANLTLRAALSITGLEEWQRLSADVNYDSNVNLQDANLVLRAALGIIKL